MYVIFIKGAIVLLFKRLLQTHSPYIITEKIKTLYKYYQ